MKPIPAVPVSLYKSNYRIWKVASKFTVATVGITSKLFFKFFHETSVYPNQYHLDSLVRENCDRPIITVSNHMRQDCICFLDFFPRRHHIPKFRSVQLFHQKSVQIDSCKYYHNTIFNDMMTFFRAITRDPVATLKNSKYDSIPYYCWFFKSNSFQLFGRSSSVGSVIKVQYSCQTLGSCTLGSRCS